MSDRALFLPRDPGGSGAERFHATELTRGPWDAGAQHGGAAAAILMRAFERQDSADGLELARVTYELLRPVPLGELEVEAEVVRPGRRVQLLEGSIRTPDGLEVVRARALRVRAAVPSATRTPVSEPPPGPEQGAESRLPFRPRYSPTFAPDAVEIRFVSGAFGRGSPSTGWFRLRVPVVAGEQATALQGLAAAGDFGNGISAILPWDEYVFINPDLTLYIDRPPEGDWICLEAQTTIAPGGVGSAESVLYDERGRVGRAIQALLVTRR